MINDLFFTHFYEYIYILLFKYFKILILHNFLQATQLDNPDRYALATVIVSREGGYGAVPTAGMEIYILLFI